MTDMPSDPSDTLVSDDPNSRKSVSCVLSSSVAKLNFCQGGEKSRSEACKAV